MSENAHHNEGIRSSFKHDLTTPITSERLIDLRQNYLAQIIGRQSELNSATEKEIPHLQATGEYPIQTPYDALSGVPTLLPPEMVADALVIRQIDLETLTHPERVQTLKTMEEKGYQPIAKKNIPVLEAAMANGETVSFGDFGFDIPTVEETAVRLGIDPEEVEGSANEILAKGTFSWTTDKRPTLPYLFSSTPDVIGAHALETIAVAQGIGFVPVDSIWTDKDNQLRMWERANEILENEPALQGHQDRDYLTRRAREMMGVTLKANPKDAIERSLFLYNHGVRTFRVYDPRAQMRMAETVDAVRQALGSDATILAGQTIGVSQAHELWEKGANAVIVGIGEGGICKTPTEASLAVNNLLTGYQIIKSKLGIPLIFDAGVGPKAAVAMGIGAGGVMKSQAIGKGIEKPAFMYWYETSPGNWESLYSGEAATRTKFLGGKLDKLGRPMYVEGANETVIFDPNIPSTATSLVYLSESLATALVFQRSTLSDLQHNAHPHIQRPSISALKNAAVHHTSK